MRRFAALTTALALGLACALIVSSCGGGGGGTLAKANASELNGLLDQIEQRAQAGDCAGAGSLAQQVATSIDKRTDIDPKLRSALVDGFQRIQAISSDPASCTGAATTTDTTTQSTTTQESTPTQTTDTTPNTVTTPTQSTPTQTNTTPTTTGTGGTPGGSGGIGTP